MERTSFPIAEYCDALVIASARIEQAKTISERARHVAVYYHLRDDYWISDEFVYPIRDFKEAA